LPASLSNPPYFARLASSSGPEANSLFCSAAANVITGPVLAVAAAMAGVPDGPLEGFARVVLSGAGIFIGTAGVFGTGWLLASRKGSRDFERQEVIDELALMEDQQGLSPGSLMACAGLVDAGSTLRLREGPTVPEQDEPVSKARLLEQARIARHGG